MRDNGWQWHQLDHMRIICTMLQTDNYASTSLLNVVAQVHFLMLNQQYHSTEGKPKGNIRQQQTKATFCIPDMTSAFEMTPGLWR